MKMINNKEHGSETDRQTDLEKLVFLSNFNECDWSEFITRILDDELMDKSFQLLPA